MPNTLFPGRDNYEGPTTGMFAFLHHEILCEQSRNVMERIAYIKREKPKREVWIRLHNIMYLELCPAVAKLNALYADCTAKRDALYADCTAKRDALYADFEAKRNALYADCEDKRNALYADYKAKRDALYADCTAKRNALYADFEAKRNALEAEILAYIKTEIPDCAWNGETLIFPSD